MRYDLNTGCIQSSNQVITLMYLAVYLDVLYTWYITMRSAICLMMIPNALERAAAVVYIVVPSEVTPILPDMPEALLAAAAAAAAAATALALKHNKTRSVRNISKVFTLFGYFF